MAQTRLSAICLVVDRLHSGFLGCYGNTWVHTPHIDRLAAESFVFDQAIIDSPDLEIGYRSLWQGTHALVADKGGRAEACLPDLLSPANVRTTLLTDDDSVAEHSLAARFGERIHLELSGGSNVAETVEGTRVAQAFAAATEWLGQAKDPYLLWLHTRGLAWPWDAPLEFRNQFADEEDPPPPSTTEVPCRMLPEDFDPDELWGCAQAYAGQIALVDACVGVLLDEIRRLPADAQPLVWLFSPRGFPMGEHRRLGPVDDALYGELIQVPWMVRQPGGAGGAARSQALVQPADLAPTLLSWFKLAVSDSTRGGRNLLPLIRGEEESVRDRAVCVAGAERAIRTPGWHLRLPGGGEKGQAELFVKPDDRFEVNEVSSRAPQVATRLTEALGQFEAAAQLGSITQLPLLDDELSQGQQ